MRRVLLAIAVGFSSGPVLLQAYHDFAHEHDVAHVHHHDGDADHRHDDDAGHAELVPSAMPSVFNAAPRVEAFFSGVAAAMDSVVIEPVSARKDRLRDLGPPHHPPGRLLSAVPSNRAPPA